MHDLGAALTAEEKALLAQAAKERADIIDKYDKVMIVFAFVYHIVKHNTPIMHSEFGV